MAEIFNDNVISAIWEQIRHERTNASVYMYIGAFLKNKGLDKLASKFEEQHDEETNHAKKLVSLLTDLNAPVTILDIPKVDLSINSILDVANAYLDVEIRTTNQLTALKNLAIQENTSIIEELIREMIAMQQKELEEATTFLDKAMLLTEWWQVALWDSSL